MMRSERSTICVTNSEKSRRDYEAFKPGARAPVKTFAELEAEVERLRGEAGK